MYARPRSGNAQRVPGASGAQAGRSVLRIPDRGYRRSFAGGDRATAGATRFAASLRAIGMRRAWRRRERIPRSSRIAFIFTKRSFPGWERCSKPKALHKPGRVVGGCRGFEGISWTEGERGFSLMADGPLDITARTQSRGNGGGPGQLRSRENAGRFDLPIRRGKEEQKNSQSNPLPGGDDEETVVIAGRARQSIRPVSWPS